MTGRRYLAYHYPSWLVGRRDDKVVGIYIEITYVLVPNPGDEITPRSRETPLFLAPTTTPHSAD